MNSIALYAANLRVTSTICLTRPKKIFLNAPVHGCGCVEVITAGFMTRQTVKGSGERGSHKHKPNTRRHIAMMNGWTDATGTTYEKAS